MPLDWATTQNNLGAALRTLGERESGTARLEEAVAAYRAALEEWTRERVPLDWATTQMNLGTALLTLGERESGTARLRRRSRPIARRWRMDARAGAARLGDDADAISALRSTLGERESGTARLEEAVAAYRGAGGKDARARAARLGDDAEQSRRRARSSGSGRAGRRGSMRRSRPIGRRWRTDTRSGCRSTGR